MMGGGGGGPFHAGGSGMGPMGGSMSHGPMTGPSMSAGSGMQGPHPPGGGGMGMGGPQSPGHASMFNPAQCLRQVRCPQWCLMIDSYGCHSCPCGPGKMAGYATQNSDETLTFINSLQFNTLKSNCRMYCFTAKLPLHAE
jgi:hypothetical protein